AEYTTNFFPYPAPRPLSTTICLPRPEVGDNPYKGKIVVLMNEICQSWCEGHVTMFKERGATLIGSHTADVGRVGREVERAKVPIRILKHHIAEHIDDGSVRPRSGHRIPSQFAAAHVTRMELDRRIDRADAFHLLCSQAARAILASTLVL